MPSRCLMLSRHDHIDLASWCHWRFCEWAILSFNGKFLSVKRTLLSFWMDDFKLVETTADVSFEAAWFSVWSSESSVYDDLDDEHGQYSFLRFSQKQQTITDRDHVSVFYHHRVMRKFSFRRRISFKTYHWLETTMVRSTQPAPWKSSCGTGSTPIRRATCL